MSLEFAYARMGRVLNYNFFLLNIQVVKQARQTNFKIKMPEKNQNFSFH